MRQPERLQRLEDLTGDAGLVTGVLGDGGFDLAAIEATVSRSIRSAMWSDAQRSVVGQGPVAVAIGPVEDVADGAVAVGGRHQVGGEEGLAGVAPELVVRAAFGDGGEQGLGAQLGGQHRVATRQR